MPLRWVEAERSHTPDLASFVCTFPPSKTFTGTRIGFHPVPWELELQSYLRGFRIPLREPDYMILGYDEDQLVAVVTFSRDGDDEYWIVDAIGRAYSHRNMGIGEEALTEALRRMDAFGLHGWIATQIHPSNHKSRALFAKFGFEHSATVDGAEIWLLDRSSR